MPLENIVLQARDPREAGRFWSAALGLTELTDGEDLYEGRLEVGEGVWFDVCVERVDRAPEPGPRLHLDLRGGTEQDAVVERLLGLGARHLDIGQGDAPWVVLADPDGNPFCVMETRDAYRDTGPIAALPLHSADPEADAALYAALTGWVRVDGYAPASLRHPAMRGPLLEFCHEPAPKTGQNRLHLDIRPAASGADQTMLVEQALELGARPVADAWAQGHPWVVLQDRSGNEFCILADPA